MTDTSIQKITIVVPGSSSGVASERDTHIGRFMALGITDWWNYRYIDSSPLGMWAYNALGYSYSNGIVTVVQVKCSGMAHPPSGSSLVPMPDPGPGTTYTWAVMGAPYRVITPGDPDEPTTTKNPPTQNNYLWTWDIPANSPTVVADFTAAIQKVIAGLSGSSFINYYKYVDSVSGAWAVYAVILYIGAGFPTPVGGMVTCSGTPHPPTGSPLPAVALPAFTQTFTSIGAPLALRPGR